MVGTGEKTEKKKRKSLPQIFKQNISNLEKYQVISEQITYIAEDIRKNKLLRFRLNHFKYIDLSLYEEEDYETEGYYL